MAQRNLIEQLRREIHLHLQQCDASHTPGVCVAIQTQAGYSRIENLIIDMAIAEGVSIGTAITTIETELES